MDIKKLTEEPSLQVREMLGSKIAMDYRSGNFTVAEEMIAADIFRILLKDVETRIRCSLSEQLAHCPRAPRDIILKLAKDETDVAVHVLEHSAVLTEDDLIALVNSTREIAKLCSVARRQTISEELSKCLLDTHHTEVFQELFSNNGASFNEKDVLQSWDFIVSHKSLLETLAHRGGLALTIVEKIFHAVSDEMKRHLTTRYKLHTPFIHKAVNDIKEWEMLGLIPSDSGNDPNDDIQVEDLVDDLYLKGRLTHSLLMRSLCVGNLNVFEAGIARMANVPRVNARILLMESSGMGLEAIYKVAAMPEGFLEAVKTLLRISLEETEYGRIRRADFRRRVIDRIYAEQYHQTVENMQYLLSIIGGKILATADVH